MKSDQLGQLPFLDTCLTILLMRHSSRSPPTKSHICFREACALRIARETISIYSYKKCRDGTFGSEGQARPA